MRKLLLLLPLALLIVGCDSAASAEKTEGTPPATETSTPAPETKADAPATTEGATPEAAPAPAGETGAATKDDGHGHAPGEGH